MPAKLYCSSCQLFYCKRCHNAHTNHTTCFVKETLRELWEEAANLIKAIEILQEQLANDELGFVSTKLRKDNKLDAAVYEHLESSVKCSSIPQVR